MARRSASRSVSPSRSARKGSSSSSSKHHSSSSRVSSSSRHRHRSRSRSRSPHRHSSRRSKTSDHADKKRRYSDEINSENAKKEDMTHSSNDGAEIKANVVEKNGEISMSIEETNRVRAALGLKPLSLGPKKDKTVNLQKTAAQVEDERARDELQKAIAQSKKKRELTQKLAGQSLGEQLKSSAAKTSLEWVKQARLKSTSGTEPSDGASKEMKGTDKAYDASALAGMAVGHDINTFEEGVDMVLTLKDTRVLAEDGNDLNDQEDELVNVELSEQDRRQAQKEQAQRAVMPVYTGYDDDEFIQVQMGKRNNSARSNLLSQYDEEDDRKARSEARKFRLDATGNSKVERKADTFENEGELDGVEIVSLARKQTKPMDEYYTKEEIEAQFAKKKGKKLRKKKKPLRTRPVEEEDAGEDTTLLVQQLEAEALRNKQENKDRGRRKRRMEEDDSSKLADIEEENLSRFQEARDRANTEALNALEAMKTKKKRRLVAFDDDMMEDSMDIELSASLAHTRRLAQLNQQKSGEAISSEDKIAAFVNETLGSTKNTGEDINMNESGGEPAVGHIFGETLKELENSSNVVVFNEATDFETRLKNAMEQRTAQFQAAAVKPAVTPQPADETKSDSKTNGMDKMATEKKDEEMKEDESEEETKENEVWGEEQPLVGAGMSATLALLRKTGDLSEKRVEKQAGRTNDTRDRNLEAELRIKDGVKLDYRDEFGRLLTKKEAFRLLSYKFHGHEPGKKKKEKRLKQLKEELEAQKALSGEGSTKMMKVLEKKQKAAKQAHVVLSGGM